MCDHNERQQHSVILPEPSLRVSIESEKPMGQHSEILVRFSATNAYNALAELQEMRETHPYAKCNIATNKIDVLTNIINLIVSSSNKKATVRIAHLYLRCVIRNIETTYCELRIQKFLFSKLKSI